MVVVDRLTARTLSIPPFDYLIHPDCITRLVIIKRGPAIVRSYDNVIVDVILASSPYEYSNTFTTFSLLASPWVNVSINSSHRHYARAY
jgi:hypothetical protein